VLVRADGNKHIALHAEYAYLAKKTSAITRVAY
jgi:hypothetical protein